MQFSNQFNFKFPNRNINFAELENSCLLVTLNEGVKYTLAIYLSCVNKTHTQARKHIKCDSKK